MLYNINIIETSIKQITVIIRRINSKISILCATKLIIRYEFIHVKFKEENITQQEQAISSNQFYIKHSRYKEK